MYSNFREFAMAVFLVIADRWVVCVIRIGHSYWAELLHVHSDFTGPQNCLFVQQCYRSILIGFRRRRLRSRTADLANVHNLAFITDSSPKWENSVDFFPLHHCLQSNKLYGPMQCEFMQRNNYRFSFSFSVPWLTLRWFSWKKQHLKQLNCITWKYTERIWFLSSKRWRISVDCLDPSDSTAVLMVERIKRSPTQTILNIQNNKSHFGSSHRFSYRHFIGASTTATDKCVIDANDLRIFVLTNGYSGLQKKCSLTLFPNTAWFHQKLSSSSNLALLDKLWIQMSFEFDLNLQIHWIDSCTVTGN